jgi:putative oxidoreductase
MKILSMKNFWLALRLSLAGIFIFSSLYKIGSPADFAHQIYNYRILPPWAINPLANILPWFQLLCGLGLLWPRFSQGAALSICGMMLVFQAALGSALMRGLNISCGCFNAGGGPATGLTFLRDFLILCLAVLVAWRLIWKNNEA